MVFWSEDELDILEALIESNKQRSKTPEIIGREYTNLQWILHERNSRQGERTDRAESTSVKQITEVQAPSRQAAEQLGVSHVMANQASQVVAVIDKLKDEGHSDEAEALRTKLNKSGAAPAYPLVC